MNWYKIASEDHAVAVTPEQFGAMTPEEKQALGKKQPPRNTNLSPQTQRLFFTEDYVDKHEALRHLALNPGITQETQRLFFTEKYKYKDWVLQDLAQNRNITQETQSLFFTGKFTPHSLAWNPSITLETQRLFFTESYEEKNQSLENLAHNERIAPATQLLFFTEQYKDKDKVLWNLTSNYGFLRNFTKEQRLQIKNAARGVMRLLVLSKRLKQIVEVS